VTQVLRYDTGRVNAALWAAVSVGGWEVCLDFTGTDRAALLTQLSGAKERVGYRKFCGKSLRARAYTKLCEASVRELHTVAFHRALVAEVGAKMGGDEEGAVFGFKAGTRERLAEVMREHGVRERYAIVHPGTARREKFWLAERWVEVVLYLKGAGCQRVMTGTGVGLEAEDVAAIRAEEGVVDLTGKLALWELAALMQGARVAIGVDSMAMHLAAMWKVPQVVLFALVTAGVSALLPSVALAAGDAVSGSISVTIPRRLRIALSYTTHQGVSRQPSLSSASWATVPEPPHGGKMGVAFRENPLTAPGPGSYEVGRHLSRSVLSHSRSTGSATLLSRVKMWKTDNYPGPASYFK
jgi:hypothetical protein